MKLLEKDRGVKKDRTERSYCKVSPLSSQKKRIAHFPLRKAGNPGDAAAGKNTTMSQNKRPSPSAHLGDAAATLVALLVAGLAAGILFDRLFGMDNLGLLGWSWMTLTGLVVFFLVFIPLSGPRR